MLSTLSRSLIRQNIPLKMQRFASTKNYIVPGDEGKLQKIVESAGKKVLYFTATWCPPCKAIAPVFEKLSGSNLDTTFLKIDIDQFADAASEYNIRSVPTFIFVNNQTIVSQFSGASEEALKSSLSQLDKA